MSSKMHAARDTSARCGRVLAVLREHGRSGVEGLALERLASVRAGATVVSELRRSGHDVACEYVRTTPREGKVYRFTYCGRRTR